MIDDLSYWIKDKNGDLVEKEVPRGHRRLITVFFDFVQYRQYQKTPIVDKDWSELTKEEFDEFRISPEYLAARTGYSGIVNFGQATSQSTQQTTSGTTPPRTSAVTTSEELFKRGIKRDQSLFPTIKDERFHDSWHRTFENQAHAQGLDCVLDSSYTPPPSEIQVFSLMNTFMYAVLESKVLTSKGKEIV